MAHVCCQRIPRIDNWLLYNMYVLWQDFHMHGGSHCFFLITKVHQMSVAMERQAWDFKPVVPSAFSQARGGESTWVQSHCGAPLP